MANVVIYEDARKIFGAMTERQLEELVRTHGYGMVKHLVPTTWYEAKYVVPDEDGKYMTAFWHEDSGEIYYLTNTEWTAEHGWDYQDMNGNWVSYSVDLWARMPKIKKEGEK